MKNRCLEADLIIVGGGSAGCLAAIRALEFKPDLKVVILEKGDLKYSGSIARGMDARNKLFEIAAKAMEANPDDLVLENKKIFVAGSPDKFFSIHPVFAYFEC